VNPVRAVLGSWLLLAREEPPGGDALLRYANTDASAFYPWNMD
jgi:hypothetical protein